jgi:hypothetical protein
LLRAAGRSPLTLSAPTPGRRGRRLCLAPGTFEDRVDQIRLAQSPVAVEAKLVGDRVQVG